MEKKSKNKKSKKNKEISNASLLKLPPLEKEGSSEKEIPDLKKTKKSQKNRSPST